MECNDGEKKCCGACFVGKSRVVDLFGKVVTAAHSMDGRLVVQAGGVNFSAEVAAITGDLAALIGKKVTIAYINGTTAPLPETWSYLEISCGDRAIKAYR